MAPSTRDPLSAISRLLEQRYGAAGQAAARRLAQWLSGAIPHASPDVLARHLAEAHLPLLFDAFWQVLPFGTGGRRGRVGYGANRLNPSTVAMTVQGHCRFLRGAFPGRADLAVVVANDVRVFCDIARTYAFLGGAHPLLGVSSRSLGRLACEIYAGNGITVYFAEPHRPDAVLSTPELSHAIARLGAAGGINLSASHNPPDDNGIKLYDEHGSQPVAPDDQRLVDVMGDAVEIRSLPFADALDRGLIRPVPATLHDEYVGGYLKLYGGLFEPRPDVPIVFTPLCGCGDTTAGDVLRRAGFPVITPPDQSADGSFASIPFKSPNPEVPEATGPARAFADAHGARVVLSSDPDADRVGLEAKLADGSWQHFDGNQIGAILCYFLMLDARGPRRRGLVIETLVTTRMLRPIVERAGDSRLIDDLLVGFKYVAHVLKTLARDGRYGRVACAPQDLVLAAEESHGVILLPGILDKDAAPACLYLAALHQQLEAEGRTLFDYYLRILEELGGYAEINRSLLLSGAAGVAQRDALMRWLRESPPASIGGVAVRRIVDRWDENAYGPFVSETDRLPRNVIQIETDAAVVTLRPSGTEPKIKIYCQILPETTPDPGTPGAALFHQARARADAIARAVYRELCVQVGIPLGDVALRLPDIVDLALKRAFEQETVPRLREALAPGRHADLASLLAWLRRQAAPMTPGADPLPALKGSVEALCRQWAAEGPAPSPPLLGALAAWAATDDA